MKAVAQIVSLYCKCGGQFIDEDTSSYDITSNTKVAQCDTCGKLVAEKQFPKTARLFVQE